MKINQLNLEEQITSKFGLKPIKIDRLGNVVAFVGKNGSGKTRVLNLFEEQFSTVTSFDAITSGNISNLPELFNHHLNNLIKNKEFADKHDELLAISASRKTNPRSQDLANKYQIVRTEYRTMQQKLIIENQNSGNNNPLDLYNQSKKSLDNIISRFKADYLKIIKYSEIRQLQEAISDNENTQISFENLVESVGENLDYNELGSIYKSALRFLRKLPHQLADDWMECLGDTKKFEKRISYSRYISLKEIFENLFGKSLEWETLKLKKKVTDQGVDSTVVGVWKINGREFNYTEFSEGEKTLFAYVLLFFLMSQNKKIRLKDSIIVIDEPELHLHPDAEIELITGIKNIIEDSGQLWIATHSINILSHLNFDEIFVVKNGEVFHSTKSIQRDALRELFHIEDRVQKLSEFITSISEWSFIHFMFECFTKPDVIEFARSNDPQVESLKQIVNLNAVNKNAILLDVGAGKGRLFEQAMQDEVFNKSVDYFALEPNHEFHSSLINKGVKRVFGKYDELEIEKFDFVVLCNVLHEIELDYWESSINKIIESLKPTGHLIIMEAKSLSKGEKIGEVGFLLLDELEFKILFDLDKEIISLKHKEENNRITSVLIPKSDLKPIRISNIMNAMKALEKNTLLKIEKLRADSLNEVPSPKFGRLSAFLSQLHINSRIAQKYIENKLHLKLTNV